MEWASKHDVWFAIILALALGVAVDFFRIGSRLRDGIRHIQNRMAEQSVFLLTKRIEQLQIYQKKARVRTVDLPFCISDDLPGADRILVGRRMLDIFALARAENTSPNRRRSRS